jgi:hypothetical protein
MTTNLTQKNTLKVAEAVREHIAEAEAVRASGDNLKVQRDQLVGILDRLGDVKNLYLSMGASGRPGANLAGDGLMVVAAHVSQVDAEIKSQIAAIRKTVAPAPVEAASPAPAPVQPASNRQDEAAAVRGTHDLVILRGLQVLLVVMVIGFVLFLVLNLTSDPTTFIGGMGILAIFYFIKKASGSWDRGKS